MDFKGVPPKFKLFSTFDFINSAQKNMFDTFFFLYIRKTFALPDNGIPINRLLKPIDM